jgi:hypothetical protein
MSVHATHIVDCMLLGDSQPMVSSWGTAEAIYKPHLHGNSQLSTQMAYWFQDISQHMSCQGSTWSSRAADGSLAPVAVPPIGQHVMCELLLP